MTDQNVPDVTDKDRRLARDWAEHIINTPEASLPMETAAARVLLALLPRTTLAAMRAGMREEWGVSYQRDHENEKRTTWAWETREDAERSMRLMTSVHVYGIVRRYVGPEEEAA